MDDNAVGADEPGIETTTDAPVETANEGTPETTAPPALDPVTGLTMVGGYPLNGRLRAAALADAGKKSDPQGLVTPELISAHADRLANYDAAFPPVSEKMGRDALVKIADAEGVEVEGDANKPTILAAILAKRPAR